ncbi:DNA cytosine methyltransferase [Photobacterium angustum]|uniref:DNA cytosine methyltransferase n=1 Tax=Photobacterium angustum TaxID=661 RepID=UPI000B1EE18D|nr:DNA cytosine methyltransferase [Photobacterium angustum]PSW91268.1 DNA (cytosine-5-)-methyltransferase [Photobacterium angustum]PSX03321.1 DNA (cytosine-5-)-methyltransferase [Photobacterium angustum]PSX27609.1 DNA (cytosine-5-)-methyltransferase [Photobacterium angustum]
MSFKFIDLFAGIGGIRLGFESQGGQCVFSSEWDSHAQKTYEANFGECPHGDITKISPKDIPEHDILLGGFPCQAFSIIGKMNGFDDTRGTLFFNIAEILKLKKPKAFMLENVKQLKTHDKGNTFKVIIKTLEDLGYKVNHTVLNALDFGVPQKRERTFIVGFLDHNIDFNFPVGERSFNLESILEKDDDVPANFFVSEEIKASRIANLKKEPPFPSIWHQNVSGNVSPLPYSCALRAGASYNYLLINGVRRPTPRELLRLQGFPDDFKVVVPYTQLRKQAGNSVAVPVIKAIANNVITAMQLKNKNVA